MPTQKDLKATRKLKRKQTKVNNRRRNIGRKPLSFKHFYKTSHKRVRNEFESKHKNDSRTPPNKRRKFNGNKPFTRRDPAFGFGKNMNETEPEYKRFLNDIHQSDSDDLSTDEQDTDPIETVLEPRSETQLMDDNKHLKDEIKQHQSALQSLKDADPEFYKHLQETDGNVLSFGDQNEFDLGNLGDIDDVIDSIQKDEMKQSLNDMEIDDTANGTQDQDIDSFMNDAEDEQEDDIKFSDGGSDEEDIDDDDDIEDEDEDDDDAMFDFNVDELKNIIKDLEENKSIQSLKRILSGFCTFVELMMNKEQEKNKKVSKQSIIVANNAAFQHLLHYILTKLGTTIVSVLDISSKEQIQPSRLKKNRRYNRCRATLGRYLKYVYVFFKNVDDGAMQRLYLIHCKELVFIILSMKDSIKRLYIKHITTLWSSTSPSVRIDAFVFLYEAGKRMNTEDKDLLNLLKYMYGAYVRICKRVSVVTMPGINFMMNCMKEMYALNPVVSYRDAFKRLRSIAFHVKQCIEIMAKHQTKNTSTKEIRSNKLKFKKEETVQSVYNWRFINIIALWSKVLASHSSIKNSDLYLLFYPFIQICCSVLTLSRSSAYDPGKLKVIKAICDLINEAQKSPIANRRIYVPLAPYLISILNNPAFAKKTKGRKDKDNDEDGEDSEDRDVFDIKYKIKIGGAHFNTMYLHNALLKEGIKCLSLYFSFYSFCISFPEIVFPTQVFLGEWVSNGAIPSEMKSIVKLLSIKLKENVNWISNKRKVVTFSPKHVDQINAFLASERLNGESPLTKWVSSKQFENVVKIVNNINKVNSKGKSGGAMNGNGDDEKENKIKQEKREKKQRKKKAKMQTKEKYEKEMKEKKVIKQLKTNYKNNALSVGATVNGLADIVQDFQLSDDDDA